MKKLIILSVLFLAANQGIGQTLDSVKFLVNELALNSSQLKKTGYVKATCCETGFKEICVRTNRIMKYVVLVLQDQPAHTLLIFSKPFQNGNKEDLLRVWRIRIFFTETIFIIHRWEIKLVAPAFLAELDKIIQQDYLYTSLMVKAQDKKINPFDGMSQRELLYKLNHPQKIVVKLDTIDNKWSSKSIEIFVDTTKEESIYFSSNTLPLPLSAKPKWDLEYVEGQGIKGTEFKFEFPMVAKRMKCMLNQLNLTK